MPRCGRRCASDGRHSRLALPAAREGAQGCAGAVHHLQAPAARARVRRPGPRVPVPAEPAGVPRLTRRAVPARRSLVRRRPGAQRRPAGLRHPELRPKRRVRRHREHHQGRQEAREEREEDRARPQAPGARLRRRPRARPEAVRALGRLQEIRAVRRGVAGGCRGDVMGRGGRLKDPPAPRRVRVRAPTAVRHRQGQGIRHPAGLAPSRRRQRNRPPTTMQRPRLPLGSTRGWIQHKRERFIFRRFIFRRCPRHRPRRVQPQV